MTIVVEDGTGVAGANSYASVEYANAYHSSRGNALWTETSTSPDQGKAAALIRATQAIDATYRHRWPGSRTDGRDQALAWPRTGVEDSEGDAIASDEIPTELKDAVCEAALRELIEAGSMIPDLDYGGAIKRVKAGTAEVEFQGGATANTSFQLIDGILAGLLGSGSATPEYSGRLVRG